MFKPKHRLSAYARRWMKDFRYRVRRIVPVSDQTLLVFTEIRGERRHVVFQAKHNSLVVTYFALSALPPRTRRRISAILAVE